MDRLNFTSVMDDGREEFYRLMKDYAAELDRHQGRSTPTEILLRWTDSIIARQFEESRCLRICRVEGNAVGFLYGKIDLPTDRGFKMVGYGYVMEFYVLPEYRRRGYGRQMLLHLEEFFRSRGASQIYLTADPVTGKPFWEAMGFESKGERSPENGQEIYLRRIESGT